MQYFQRQNVYDLRGLKEKEHAIHLEKVIYFGKGNEADETENGYVKRFHLEQNHTICTSGRSDRNFGAIV